MKVTVKYTNDKHASCIRWMATAQWEHTDLVTCACGPTEEDARQRMAQRLETIMGEINTYRLIPEDWESEARKHNANMGMQ